MVVITFTLMITLLLGPSFPVCLALSTWRKSVIISSGLPKDIKRKKTLVLDLSTALYGNLFIYLCGLGSARNSTSHLCSRPFILYTGRLWQITTGCTRTWLGVKSRGGEQIERQQGAGCCQSRLFRHLFFQFAYGVLPSTKLQHEIEGSKNSHMSHFGLYQCGWQNISQCPDSLFAFWLDLVFCYVENLSLHNCTKDITVQKKTNDSKDLATPLYTCQACEEYKSIYMMKLYEKLNANCVLFASCIIVVLYLCIMVSSSI